MHRILCILGGFLATVLVGASTPAQEEFQVGEVVRRITVVGCARTTEQQIVRALGVREGDVLDELELDRGVRVVFTTFRVLVEVQKSLLPSEEGGGVALTVVVDELPVDLEPRFRGNERISDSKLLEWIGRRKGQEIYLYEAARIRERLLARYREDGHYFVEIDIVSRGAEGDEDDVAPDVAFEIREGPRVKVEDIVLTGNETFPDHRFLLFFKRGLRRLAETELRSPRFFGLFPKAFDEKDLDADILAMREVYRDFGYLDAIVEVERLEFSEDRSWVTIHVAVDEGGRYTVGSIDIEGVERLRDGEERTSELFFDEAELLDLLTLKVGEVYERRLHEDDARELRRHYGEQGYISHHSLNDADRWEFLQPELIFDPHEPIVHVTYRLAQGRQIFIREIPIVGNLHTQDRVIRRLITVKPGDLADPEGIERARQRIQSTGWFSDQFDINHREPEYRYVDTEDPSWKDLQFVVEEGQVLTFNLAGGISSNNGAFGTIALSMENFDVTDLPTSFWSTIPEIATRTAFHGAGQRLSMRASPGTERSYFDVLFSEPDLFGTHENRWSGTLSGRKAIRLYNSHEEERNEIGLRLARSLSLDAALITGYRYGTVNVDELSRGGEPSIGNPLSVPEDLKAQEGNSYLAHVLLGYRYTSIDDRLNTRNGIEFRFENEIYSEAYGSDFEFVKSEISIDWWSEFDDDPELISPYYHVQVAAGIGTPFGDTDEVPYTERFFLGGLSTLRGYRFRGVGPNEQGFPIGGQTMLHGTFEYRFPLVKQVQPGTYREYESIQGGAFFDWGVLDPDDYSVDLDEVRMTWGVLFGISVPLPITFSFGWPLREGEGDRERVFAFNIGLR